MTPDEAEARLRQMVAAGSHPVLEQDAVDDLVALAMVADSDGRAPSDEDWEPTWDLNGAAAEGWRRKAGIAAGSYAANLDGASLSRHQVHAQCIAMADYYEARCVGSISFNTQPLTVEPWMGDV